MVQCGGDRLNLKKFAPLLQGGQTFVRGELVKDLLPLEGNDNLLGKAIERVPDAVGALSAEAVNRSHGRGVDDQAVQRWQSRGDLCDGLVADGDDVEVG